MKWNKLKYGLCGRVTIFPSDVKSKFVKCRNIWINMRINVLILKQFIFCELMNYDDLII